MSRLSAGLAPKKSNPSPHLAHTLTRTRGKMRNRSTSELIAADLFCGAGGLSLGFEDAGFQIAFANDLDEDCERTYVENNPGTTFIPGSIEGVTARDIFKRTGLGRGDIDILIGGPPCQGFSINAPNRDRRDARNYLFEHYGRLVLEGLRPKVVVMENVPGMLSLDQVTCPQERVHSLS